MPNAMIKSYAKRHGKSVQAVETLWSKAKKLAQEKFTPGTDRFYGYANGILKHSLGETAGAEMKDIRGAIIEFLTVNPTPTDAQFHSFSASIGVDKEAVEAESYAMLAAFLRKFHSSNLVSRKLFDPVELKRGIEVEMEHTDDPHVAEMIAKDHLLELSDYYSQLDSYITPQEEDEETALPYAPHGTQMVAPSNNDIGYNTLSGFKLNTKSRMRSLNTASTDTDVSDDSEIWGDTPEYQALKKIASPSTVDNIARILQLDGYNMLAMQFSAAYSDMVNAFLKHKELCTDRDIITVAKYIRMTDVRKNGDIFRLTYCRAATRLMRDLALKYGQGLTGQTFLSGVGTR